MYGLLLFCGLGFLGVCFVGEVIILFKVEVGHVDDVEGIVVLAILAAAKEHLGDFLHGDARVMGGAGVLETRSKF